MTRLLHRAAIGVVAALSLSASALEAQNPHLTSSYDMDVELQVAGQRRVRGSQRIEWRNTTRFPVREIRMHLYWNAFRDRESTLMREAGPAFRALWRDDEFGSCRLQSLRLERRDGPYELEFEPIAPDDGNAADATVVRAELPEVIGPGRSIVLRTQFVSVLPKAYRRAGWAPGDTYFCTHWFPKLGVLEEQGDRAVWNCHQFHANTEFFADFSRYRVALKMPEGFVVGATGGEPVSFDADTNTRVFEQDRVHDFAFVAGRDFAVYEETFGPVQAVQDDVARSVAARFGVPVGEFDLPATKIRLLLQPEHDSAEQVRRHMRAVRCGLEFFGLRFGPYPYGTITVVDPAADVWGAQLGGGMEYPMLITCGTDLFLHPRRLCPESVVVHEFGHQYWYGLAANNEFEEAWLDEGINTYCEGRARWLEYATAMPVRTRSFGALTLAGATLPTTPGGGVFDYAAVPLRSWLPDAAWLDEFAIDGRVVPDSALLDLLAHQPSLGACREATHTDRFDDRRRWLEADAADAMVRPGWEFADTASYVANSYHRPATLLRTLEGMIGRERWWTFLRRFFMESRFGRPTTARFAELMAEECGPEFAEFFRVATAADAVFDYGVDDVRATGDVKSVTVRRYGSIRADVRVRFRFANRADPVWRTVRGDEVGTWHRFSFHDEGEPFGDLLEVWVDPPLDAADHEGHFGPAGEYLIDRNLLNNAWRADADHGPGAYRALRALLQTQSQFTFAGVIG